MKLIRILLWVVIVLNAVDAILSFTQGDYADALDKCILAFYVFLLFLAYKKNEDKDKTIERMDNTLRNIVRRVKANLVDDIKVEQLGNQGEYIITMPRVAFGWFIADIQARLYLSSFIPIAMMRILPNYKPRNCATN